MTCPMITQQETETKGRSPVSDPDTHSLVPHHLFGQVCGIPTAHHPTPINLPHDIPKDSYCELWEPGI